MQPANTTPTNMRSWLTVFAAASFFFLINSATNLTAITPYLSTKLHFDSTKIGFLFACYYYANTLFVFWAGIILDRFSPKKVLLISYIVANLSILVIALTDSIVYLSLSRLALGIVGSFSMLNCFQIIKRCFPPQKIIFITGLASTYASLGGLFAQAPLVIIIEKLGLQQGLLLNLWLGLIFGAFTLIFAQDFPPNIQRQPTNNTMGFIYSIKRIITNKQNWLIGIYTSLCALPGLFFGASWGILYLQQAKNFSQIDSAYILSLGTIGSIIGSTAIGWLADKLPSCKLLLIISNLLSLLLFLIIIYIAQPFFEVFVLLFFILGFIGSSQVVIYPIIATINPAALVSTATGFVSALTAFSGIYMLPLSWLIDFTKEKEDYNFYPTMIALTIIMAVSIFLALFIQRPKMERLPKIDGSEGVS